MVNIKGYLVFCLPAYDNSGGWNEFEFYAETLEEVKNRVTYEELSSDGTIFRYYYIDGEKRTGSWGCLQIVDLSEMRELQEDEYDLDKIEVD